MSDDRERLDWAVWQAGFWARAGKLHPASVEVATLVDTAVTDLLYWSSFDLDGSVELDDVVQMLALAQLEAQAGRGSGVEPPPRAEVQRRLRRAAWQVRLARGAHHRADWNPELHARSGGARRGPGRDGGSDVGRPGRQPRLAAGTGGVADRGRVLEPGRGGRGLRRRPSSRSGAACGVG